MILTEKDKLFAKQMKERCTTPEELKINLKMYAEEELGDCTKCAEKLYEALLKEVGLI